MSENVINHNKAKKMRFMLIFGSGGTSKRCCCCLSLRIGAIIISLFVLSFKIPFYFTTYFYFTKETRVPIIMFDVFSSVAYIILLIGVLKTEFKYAYLAHILSAITAYLYIIGGLIIVILLGAVFKINNAEDLIKTFGFELIYSIFIIAYIGNIVGYVVNNYFVFCYAKELGMGHYDVIYAKDELNLDNLKNTKEDMGSPLMNYSKIENNNVN